MLKQKIQSFIEKYLIYIVTFVGFLSLLPYITVFKALEINNTLGVVYRGLVLFLSCVIFLGAFFIYKDKANLKAILLVSIYAITNILTIFLSPAINKIEVPLFQQGIGLTVIAGNIISVFAALFFLNEANISKNTLKVLTHIFITFGLFLCLYTYVFEYKEIINTFTKDYGWNYDVKSIFTSKTSYGFCLFAISTYAIVYALTNKKYYYYIFPVFFLINAFISRSKTTILCLLILLLGVLIYYIITSWNKYKKTWIVVLSILLGLGVIGLLLVLLKVGPFAILNKFLNDVIIHDGVVVTQDRISRSSNVLNAINNPFNIIFGCGERTTNYIIAPAKISGDEVYITNYATGGIIKSVLYFVLIGYIIYKYIKSDLPKSTKFMQFVILFAFLVAGIFEFDSLIGLNTSLIITPIIFNSNNFLH